jgi:RPA family protein
MAEIEKQEGSLLFSLISEMVAELAVQMKRLWVEEHQKREKKKIQSQ